jgi:hypothetical protein
MVALERYEVAVSSIRRLQRSAVLRHNEVVAVGVGEQCWHKRTARDLHRRHVVQVEIAAPLYGDAQQRDGCRHEHFRQAYAGYVPDVA